jgi:site-specific recombinase XerD
MHDLRHTFASLMLDSGADIVDVQKQLGHTQIKTTCIYLHLRQERKREKANAAEAASGVFM